MDTLEFLTDPAFWRSAIRLSIPLLLAALGVLVAERSGVLNIGMEGCMLMGAALGSIVAITASSPTTGLLAAIAAGAAVGLLLATLTVLLPASQVAAGIAVNILALGASAMVVRYALGASGALPHSHPFPTAPIPALEHIPGLGPALFRHDAVTYLAGGLTVGLWWFLLRTRRGTQLRAIGDAARSAAAIGLHISRTRWGAMLASGALGGLAGGYLTVVHLTFFVENGVAGRGYVALALVVFARWHPLGLALAALIVGTMDAYQLRLQAAHDLSVFELLTALPYIAVLILLILRPGHLRPPRELGRPWAQVGR